MKPLSIALAALITFFSITAFAQSDAQKSFEKLKTLAGTWEGKGIKGEPLQVTFRMTSNGSAIMSEIQGPEDMISMFHLDGDRLLMTHYCSAGNQPRMVGKMAPDGKSVTFDFLDVTNFTSSQPGHMQHVVLTMLDANHHTEDWDFMDRDGQQHEHERLDLQRTK